MPDKTSLAVRPNSGFVVDNSPSPDVPPPPDQPPMRFAVLGIHDETVPTVDGDVARVRMFLNSGEMVDEDFNLPVLDLPGVAMTAEIYAALLEPSILVRLDQLDRGAKPA